jgi:hypothetical protein
LGISILIRSCIALVLCFLLLPVMVIQAEGDISFSCQVPYYLGKSREAAVPGEKIQALFSIENRGMEDKEIDVSLSLPPGFLPLERYDNWQIEQQGSQYSLQRHIKLTGGYSQWFDLFAVQATAELQPGTYTIVITDGITVQQIPIRVASGKGRVTDGPITLEDVVLPLDKDGKMDDRLNRNTLVLRDRRWDYYKNLLRGKGASNQEIEAIHPLTHLGLDIKNPAKQQNLAVVTVQLLDANTHQPVPGLFTPGTTGEDVDAGALAGHDDSLVALVALNGEERQRIQLPVYADEQLVSAGGQYILQVQLEEEGSPPLIKEVSVKIVKKNSKAAVVVCAAIAVLLFTLLVAVGRIRSVLAGLKTRWLVTIALFGAAAFAVVNVPATLFNDFFHILLGPFGFLVTGLFHSVFLYMMTVALVILIPRPGVVALMTIMRLLLGMLAFGQISPIGLLSYGMHALLLEVLLIGTGMYRRMQQEDHGAQRIALGQVVLIALICAIADSIATYVNMQGMALLYRLYYADWYIGLILLVNGFIYTFIGATCGTLLGSKLSRVGGD